MVDDRVVGEVIQILLPNAFENAVVRHVLPRNVGSIANVPAGHRADRVDGANQPCLNMRERLGMLRSTCCAAAASRNLPGTQRYLLKMA